MKLIGKFTHGARIIETKEIVTSYIGNIEVDVTDIHSLEEKILEHLNKTKLKNHLEHYISDIEYISKEINNDLNVNYQFIDNEVKDKDYVQIVFI